MKGLRKFLGETWWLFAGAAAINIAMAVTSGFYFYLAFLPALVVIALYMATVRYDKDGNHRGENP